MLVHLKSIFLENFSEAPIIRIGGKIKIHHCNKVTQIPIIIQEQDQSLGGGEESLKV